MGNSWKTKEFIKIFDFIGINQQTEEKRKEEIVEFAENYVDKKFIFEKQIEWAEVKREITTPDGKKIQFVFEVEFISKDKKKRVIYGVP